MALKYGSLLIICLLRAYKLEIESSVCWDPLQTLGIQDERRETILCYSADESPG